MVNGELLLLTDLSKYGIDGFVLPSKPCPVFMLVDVFRHCQNLFCGKCTIFLPHFCGDCGGFSPHEWGKGGEGFMLGFRQAACWAKSDRRESFVRHAAELPGRCAEGDRREPFAQRLV
jgi:hypothetical protein